MFIFFQMAFSTMLFFKNMLGPSHPQNPVQTDNTAREAKNQTMVLYESMLVGQSRFLSCDGCGPSLHLPPFKCIKLNGPKFVISYKLNRPT